MRQTVRRLSKRLMNRVARFDVGARREPAKRAVLAGLVVLASWAAGGGGDGFAQSGGAVADIPRAADPSGKYFFYLHARIVEVQGRGAVSRVHGPYRYDDIVRALADRGFVVVSEVRPPTTTLPEYGRKIAGQVRTLLAAGVSPESITVAGFSKGGAIAVVASAELGHPRVNFVVMAGCGIGRFEAVYRGLLEEFAPRVRGRFLSLYDAADQEAASCQALFDRAPGLVYKEIKLNAGSGHGLFYAPRAQWLNPVVDWAARRP